MPRTDETFRTRYLFQMNQSINAEFFKKDKNQFVPSLKPPLLIIFQMIGNVQSFLSKKIQRKEKESEWVHFEFPNQLFRTKLFQDSLDLNRDISRLGMKYYFKKGRVFNRDELRNLNGSKIVYKCKHSECAARLVYHKKAGSLFYDPVVFQNLHQHARSKDPMRAKRQDINVFTMQLRGEQFEKYRKIPRWVEKFDVSNVEGLWIVEQLYWSSNTEDETLTYLAHQNITIRRLSLHEESMVIFLATQSMKQNFLLYGETITIETHSQTGKKRAVIENHAVGYLFGQNENIGLVLLGIFMIAEESKMIYRKIFQFFFETVCGAVMPTCIISDRKEQIADALKELRLENKYNFTHLYPWYHMTGRFMDSLQKIQGRQKLMQMMCSAMQVTSENDYCQLVSQLKTNLKSEPQIFDYFKQGQGKYCLRRIPVKFSGFALSTSFGKTVRAQVTDSAIYRAHSGRFFTRLLKIQRDLINASKKIDSISLDVIRHFPAEITSLWQKIQSRIMKILITNYNNSKDCEIKQENEIEVRVIEKNREFLCKFQIKFDHWSCECQELERTGLPCSHLIRILLDTKYNGSLLYYINSRWMHSKVESKKFMVGPFITNKVRTHFTCFV